MIRAGYRLPGASLAIVGNVPQGAGLSSSASLSVAIARALLSISDPNTADAATLASWAQWSEHHFAGCRCGIMDPMAAAAAEPGAAMLLDCRSLERRAITLPKTMAVLIAHSGVRRQLIDGEYNRRREQCEAVVAASGIAALRDLDSAGLDALRSKISPTEFRRARHVVSENDRVLSAVLALEHGDLQILGRLLHASHESLRDDFEVTVPAVNALVECLEGSIRRHAEGRGGARMTGGGFGGCVVAVMDAAALPQVEKDLRRWLQAHVDGPPLVLQLGAP
jgi:galactokinase